MYIETLEIAGFYSAIIGMRNPLNSWEKSDSFFNDRNEFFIGDADLRLAKNLVQAGTEHGKFLRQIQVWADVNMPRYWWSEADTYKFGTKNSCSTMHTLLNKKRPIEMDDFWTDDEDLDVMEIVIQRLNSIRFDFINAKSQSEKDHLLLRAKKLLPESFIQLRTWNTNYAELLNMYNQRKHHRLKDEWIGTFCTWCEGLPYFNEICLDK